MKVTPRRMRIWKLLGCLCGSLWLASYAGAQARPEVSAPEKLRTFFDAYCVSCHGPEKQKGKLRLDEISLSIDSLESAARWQKILNQLNSGEMPPDEAKQPVPEAKVEFLDSLSHTLMEARRNLADQGGAVTLRRLNRREYRNTMRDLLGVEVDTHDLPADGGTGAFDTVGSGLFMSSDQIEQYLTLARRALDDHAALRAAQARPHPFRAHVEAEEMGNRRMDGLYHTTQENHARYVRWTAAVNAAAERPANVEIARLLHKKAEKPRPSSGMPYATPLLFYLDWEQIPGAPAPSQFGFKDAQEAFFDEVQYIHFFTYYEGYQKLPGRDRGAWLMFYQAYRESYVKAGQNWPLGRYTLRMRVAANPEAAAERRFVEVGQRGEDVSNFTVMGAHQVTGILEHPQVIEQTVELSVEGKREFALRERRPNSHVAEIRSFYDEYERSGHGPPPAIWVDWFEIEGPLPLAKDNALETPAPQDVAGARQFLTRFAERAFRGKKPEGEFVKRLVKLFEAQVAGGGSFDEALKTPLSVVLASPSFLYLSEPVEDDQRRPLSGPELATRLAYFLWSAPPDEELRELGASGQLFHPATLAAQVDRLLDSPKAEEFSRGFTHQWLGMDRLDFFQFDFRRHREFDDSVKAAAREEVYHTISYLLKSGGGLGALLKSDYVVVNGLLANFYGLPGVTGDEFRRVDLPRESPRGGLLGMAAILAMGSNGETSSPVERGAWVLRKLLHDPPPPAPPNVPQLARLEGKVLTTRERLRAHHELPQCANCHRRIDPIGLGLENFDAVGKWRRRDRYDRKGVGSKTWPIDPAGSFFHGAAFRDYFELRDVIASQPQRLARGFAEGLLEYGLGRPVSFQDEELLAHMLKVAQAKGYELRVFMHELVASEAFRSK